MNAAADQPLRILIIDDDPLFHGLIGGSVEVLGYTWQSASTLEEALLAIKRAEENNKPFAVITIDMKFEVGRGEMSMPIGKMILQKIKSQYPNLACIIISGSSVSAHEVLDLRDDYALDYYISKDRLDLETFDRGVKKALKRVRPCKDNSKRCQVLLEALERYRDIQAICLNNLALVEEKKALKGINVSVDLENQIRLYKTQLHDTRQKIKEVEEELKKLTT